MVKINKPKLHITHCIDTEGPIHEPLSVTFQRLKEIYNIELEPTKENLKKIQNQQIDFGPYTNSISQSFSGHLLAYNDTWDKIDIMLDKIMSQEFRNRFQDSNGNGIIYNWHCLDNVGFVTNERRRDIGFGNVFVHYQNKISLYSLLIYIYISYISDTVLYTVLLFTVRMY